MQALGQAATVGKGASAIEQATFRLREANNSLAAVSDNLISRLQAVLQPSSPAENVAGRLVAAPSCPLEEVIVQEAGRIEQLAAFLDDALIRLQL